MELFATNQSVTGPGLEYEGRMSLDSRYSPDGHYWWDGTNWRPAISPDRQWFWDGQGWITASASQRGRPVLPVVDLLAGVTIVILIMVSVIAYAAQSFRLSGKNSSARVPYSTSIPCDLLENTQVHYHVELQVLNQGKPVGIPTGVGRSKACYYWLHMHDGESGMIHIESPSGRVFTLGDFFAVWSAWGQKAQPLDGEHIASLTLKNDQKLLVYVDTGDGTGAHLFTGEPSSIVLRNHEVITLEIIPPRVSPPPFVFPSGF